jgi:hypothetical protein
MPFTNMASSLRALPQGVSSSQLLYGANLSQKPINVNPCGGKSRKNRLLSVTITRKVLSGFLVALLWELCKLTREKAQDVVVICIKLADILNKSLHNKRYIIW